MPGMGFLMGYVFYSDADSSVYPLVPIALAVYGFFIGLVLCHCVLMVIASCVIALFVCYAEDPGLFTYIFYKYLCIMCDIKGV